MKAILRIALVLVIMTAGVAWAADGELEKNLPAPTPQVEQPQVEQPDQTVPEAQAEPRAQAEALDIEKLLNANPDKVNAGACCWAECHEEMVACWAECGWDPACRAECRDEFDSCKQNC